MDQRGLKTALTFEEQPVDFVWRFSEEAAPLARNFVFRHGRTIGSKNDGKILVRFLASGLLEMAWYVITFGEHVEVPDSKGL